MYYINLSNDIREYYNEEGFDYEKFKGEEGLGTLIELHNNAVIEFFLDYGFIKDMYELDNELSHKTATEIIDMFEYSEDYIEYSEDYGGMPRFNTRRDYYFVDGSFEYVSVDTNRLILAMKDMDVLTEYKDYIVSEY